MMSYGNLSFKAAVNNLCFVLVDIKKLLENEGQITNKHVEKYHNSLHRILNDIKPFRPKSSAKEDKFNFATILRQLSTAFNYLYNCTSTSEHLCSAKSLRASELRQNAHNVHVCENWGTKIRQHFADFWQAFYIIFSIPSLSNEQRFLYLKQHLTDSPERLLSRITVSAKNYVKAAETLEKQYDNRDKVTADLYRQLLNLPAAVDKPINLWKIYNDVEAILCALELHGKILDSNIFVRDRFFF